jgi:hypothetical protein
MAGAATTPIYGLSDRKPKLGLAEFRQCIIEHRPKSAGLLAWAVASGAISPSPPPSKR